ncbi:MAG: POTRA domain-containing protein [Chitinophagaceae bacterium]
MQRNNPYCFWLLIVIINFQQLSAQESGETKSNSTSEISISNALITVGDIHISGNKKTKTNIVLREIPFKTGDKYTLEELVKKFEDARRQLMNTTLFHTVVVAAEKIDSNLATVSVTLNERWYLFPAPYFKPVDRNLNQWIVEQKASLSRVNYGAKLLYYNATGHNDKLKIFLINGYSRQFSFNYDRLYFDKKLKWGINVGFAMGKNREVNYNTVNDKQVFLKDNNSFLRNYVTTNAELTYRRKIKTRHSIGVNYTVENVKDTVLDLNPYYYKTGRNNIRYPGLYYNMSYYDFDYIPYPTKGYAAQISVSKKGFDHTFNVFELSVKGSGSWHLSPGIFFTLNLYGGIRLPFKQAYINQRFLGYGDIFLQGYEYFVIDGVAGGYMKTTLTRKVLDFNIRLPKKNRKDPVHIPIRIFAKVYGNAGYVHNVQPGYNFLSNKMLYSGGFGIDILTFYDVTFKLEYTFNQLGQNGLFLHRKTIF